MNKIKFIRLYIMFFVFVFISIFLNGCSYSNSVGYVYRKLTEDTCSVSIYVPESKKNGDNELHVVIPNKFQGLKVVELDKNSFDKENYSIKSIKLGKYLKINNFYTIRRCKGLEEISVAMGSEYYSSYDGTLYSKDKTTLIFFPHSKDINNFKVPKKLKVLGSESFRNRENLYNITIPNCIEIIDADAFNNCDNLRTVNILKGNKLVSIKERAFNSCEMLEEFNLFENNTLIEICDDAFYYCKKLKSFVFPQSLRSIGKKAFSQCESLCSIQIPEGINRI